MPPKPPSFWLAENPTWQSMVLSPFAQIYILISSIRYVTQSPYKSPLPVLCVGGVVLGGSGKTPVLHALIPVLEKLGFTRPVILTRGYGGVLKGPTRVDPECHSSADVGDEALLHAAYAPTIVSVDRAAGARTAEALGADIILMDDGLQNNTLHKTFSVLVWDSHAGLGNGKIFPAGPLRETIHSALKKCGCVIVTGKGPFAPTEEKPVIRTRTSILQGPDRDRDYTAFAGIGYPDKFRRTLEEGGYKFSSFHAFADHHPYTVQDMEGLLSEGNPLLTTEKDMVRIPLLYRANVHTVSIEISFSDISALEKILKDGLIKS